MDITTLEVLKKRLYDLLIDGPAPVLEALNEVAPIGSAVFKTLLLLRSRFKMLENEQNRGVIDHDTYHLGLNRLRSDIIDFIHQLDTKDFEREAPEATVDPGQTGRLLYQIPEQMQVHRAELCRVRLAFDEATIRQNLPSDAVVEVRQLRVSEVMQVRILDVSAEKSFEVERLSREEQALREGAYAEWLFRLTPLRPGRHLLLLQVAVIEIVLGKERAYELVFEEQIEVSAESVPAAAPAFKPAAVLASGVEPPTTGAEPPGAFPPQPPYISREVETVDRSVFEEPALGAPAPPPPPPAPAPIPPAAPPKPAPVQPAPSMPPPGMSPSPRRAMSGLPWLILLFIVGLILLLIFLLL